MESGERKSETKEKRASDSDLTIRNIFSFFSFFAYYTIKLIRALIRMSISMREYSKITTIHQGLLSEGGPIQTSGLTVDDNGNFVEVRTQRTFKMHGINFASSSKFPSIPFQTSYLNPKSCGLFIDADKVSFVGKPFPLCEAYEHITRIKQCGFNTIRFVMTWEAIEHEGPDIYDIDYVDYVIDLLKIIDEIGGLYVFLDPHQDVWSKFSGGSGAPLWTLYAAGLEPKNFKETVAAKVHNFCENPKNFTKMVWATNYFRLASEVMFTLFFSGNIFTPKAVINNQNIEDFLQNHFIEAIAFMVSRIKDKLPNIFGKTFLGVESLNEPNSGFYGFEDLNIYPPHQELKLDETPTPVQALRLGMGFPQELDIFHLTIFGPSKKGTEWFDPKGVKAWIENDEMDKHYGFDRGNSWKYGECLFAQHGVWNSSTGELILPDYFRVNPITGALLSEETFINGPFLHFWKKFKGRMREIDNDMFLIMQPPVLEIPPMLKNKPNKADYLDDRTIVALHYYDGMSLMFKTWNRILNVDTLGIMRDKYLNPVFGLILGEYNIRKSIGKQLKDMYLESQENIGKEVPVVFTETGMPFDMDDKKAYRNGDYSSQESANDAILSGLEGNNLNFTYWNYNPDNNHEWGDLWNLEDFSVWSKDDLKTIIKQGKNYQDWVNKNTEDVAVDGTSATSSSQGSNLYQTLNTSRGTFSTSSVMKKDSNETTYEIDENLDSNSSDTTYNNNGDHGNKNNNNNENNNIDTETDFEINSVSKLLSLNLLSGVRAERAIIRPYPVLINGTVELCEFDLANTLFNLQINTDNVEISSIHKPTVIMLPELQFPTGGFKVEIDSGTIICKKNGIHQWLEWEHGVGLGILEIRVSMDEKQESPDSLISDLKAFACGYL